MDPLPLQPSLLRDILALRVGRIEHALAIDCLEDLNPGDPVVKAYFELDQQAEAAMRQSGAQLKGAVVTPAQIVEGRLMTEDELCARFRVSKAGILKHKRDPVDPIPCHLFGRRYLYDPAEVRAWSKRRAEREWKAAVKGRSR